MSANIASLAASPARRIFSLSVLGALGVLLVYIGVVHPPAAPGLQAFILVLGALVLVLVNRMRRTTALVIELRDDGLFDSTGACICEVDNIAGVEHGVFAFKPSNGFGIRLKTRQPRAWMPGMWWRVGRRVGIGGVTPGAQGKMLADMLIALVHEHQEGAPDS